MSQLSRETGIPTPLDATQLSATQLLSNEISQREPRIQVLQPTTISTILNSSGSFKYIVMPWRDSYVILLTEDTTGLQHAALVEQFRTATNDDVALPVDLGKTAQMAGCINFIRGTSGGSMRQFFPTGGPVREGDLGNLPFNNKAITIALTTEIASLANLPNPGDIPMAGEYDL